MATLTANFENVHKPGSEIRLQAAAVQNFRGGAAAVLIGTGYATPLVVATDAMQFIGVYAEANDNRNGVAGTVSNQGPNTGYSSWVRVIRDGVFQFNQSGITQASVGQRVWFSDDNTVTTTPGQVFAGIVVARDEQSTAKVWVDITPATSIPVRAGVVAVAASGAIAPHTSATYAITKAGVAAMTLAAPTDIVDDGAIIVVTSNTANAHTITATGLLNTGAAAVNVATFAAQKGAGVTLMAYNAKWNVISSVGITFS